MANELRRAWSRAHRAWFAVAMVLATYGNLVVRGIRLIGPVPGWALGLSFLVACWYTRAACRLDHDQAGRTSDFDPLGFACAAVVAVALLSATAVALLLGTDWPVVGPLCQLALIPLGICYLLVVFAVVVMPLYSLASLLAGPFRGRALAACALQGGVVLVVAYAPQLWVQPPKDQLAVLDCTIECHRVSAAILKRAPGAAPPPAVLEEPFFKALVAEGVLANVPTHRIDDRAQVPVFYRLRGHVLCMRHFRGRF